MPSIDPSELRPARRWYWIAGIIAVVGIVIGVGGGVTLFVYGTASMTPDNLTGLSGSGTASGSVRLTAGQDWAVFATSDASWDVTCSARGTSGNATVSDPGETVNFTSHGGQWWEVARIRAPADGTYQVSCSPKPDAVSTGVDATRYMVGEAPSIGVFFGSLFGGFAVLFGVPFIACVTGGVIAIVTGVRRGGHRKQLLAERYGPPYPPYPR